MSAIRRVALVVGNGKYAKAKPDLKNPTNDAVDIAARLAANNFNVTRLVDVSYKDMDKALNAFRKALADAELGLFFFAGHGVQIDGENFLIATDTNTSDEFEAKHSSLALNKVIEAMEKTGTESNVIILDACRDNPFERAWRSGTQRGLASVYAPKGTLIGFATSPGQLAADGAGRNGAYTAALLEHLDTPDVSIENMFKRVRNTLSATTKGKQISWEHTSLAQEVYFKMSIADLIQEYSAAALSDAQFVLDVARPAHAVIKSLKSLTWGTQNTAMQRVTPEVTAAASPDTLFVLGRNIYQSACGSSHGAIGFVNHFAERTQPTAPEARKAILDGMLFEIFFDKGGEVRQRPKSGFFNEVFELQKLNQFTDSFDFIAKALSNRADDFYVLPGKGIAKSIDVVLRKNDAENFVESVHLDGKNILQIDEDGPNAHDDAKYHSMTKDHFEEKLTSEMLLPKHSTKIAYSNAVGQVTSVRLHRHAVLRKTVQPITGS